MTVPRTRRWDDRGSTVPLILGFFLVALLVVGGAVAGGQAYVHQRALQQACDGAAAAAGAAAVGLDRASSVGDGDFAAISGADRAIASYLGRDAERRDIDIRTAPGQDGTLLTLRCEETREIPFGAMFGLGGGIRHRVVSSVRAPLG